MTVKGLRNDVGVGRAVPEPPLRVVSRVGLDKRWIPASAGKTEGDTGMTGNVGVRALEWMDFG